MTAVVVAGEALVDLVTERDGRLRPLRGGSSLNVALGLGRLGVPTAYLGTISTDAFGQQLTDGLTAGGVELSLVRPVAAPTTLAVIHLDAARRASYGFYLEGTSAAALTTDALPALPTDALLHVSFGAIGAGHEPAGRALADLIEREAGRRLICLDPNLRPSAVGPDLGSYRARLEDLVTRCDVVKVSDEDLEQLHLDVEETAHRWARRGPAVVVVTRGPDGATVVTRDRSRQVPGETVEVVDTVGAGDAFTAGLLHALVAAGVHDRASLDDLDEARLTGAVRDAVAVAALTCTRAGADPPSAAELHGRT